MKGDKRQKQIQILGRSENMKKKDCIVLCYLKLKYFKIVRCKVLCKGKSLLLGFFSKIPIESIKSESSF